MSETRSVDIYEVASHLWETADELRANSHLKAAEYSIPVLGLIFLKFADSRFTEAEAGLAGTGTGRRTIGKADYQAAGVLYLPEQARFANLLELPEGENIGKAINDAMAAIEDENPQLPASCPAPTRRSPTTPSSALLRSVNSMLGDIEGDAFGKVYEYFLGKFADGRGPEGRRVLHADLDRPPDRRDHRAVQRQDPRPGVRIGRHVRPERALRRRAPQRRRAAGSPSTGRSGSRRRCKLCKMNLAVHGLEGRSASRTPTTRTRSSSVGQFDYVMANPPFNVNRIDKPKLEGDRRFPFGLPARRQRQLHLDPDLLLGAVNDTRPRRLRHGELRRGRGRLGTGDSPQAHRGPLCRRHRRRRLELLLHGHPAVTLWFLDKAKRETDRGRQGAVHRRAQDLPPDRPCPPRLATRADRVPRQHRPAVSGRADRDSRGIVGADGSSSFPDGRYVDVPGLCAVATLDQIEQQGWSLNPGRYVGVAAAEDDGVDFRVRLEELHEELEKLNAEAATLQERIAANVAELLG